MPGTDERTLWIMADDGMLQVTVDDASMRELTAIYQAQGYSPEDATMMAAEALLERWADTHLHGAD